MEYPFSFSTDFSERVLGALSSRGKPNRILSEGTLPPIV